MTDHITQPETETEMSTETITATAKKARKPKESKPPRKGSKLEAISKMLHRKNGCTAREVMESCQWPAVSMPQQAQALGIKLRTEKDGRATRYWAA